MGASPPHDIALCSCDSVCVCEVVGFDVLEEHLLSIMHVEDAILVLGCGTSALPGQLHEAGYRCAFMPVDIAHPLIGGAWCRDVLGVDNAPSAIAQMNEQHADKAGLRFQCMDVTNLETASNSVDVVLEKCVLDCFACSQGEGEDAITRMLSEAARVLRPGGAYVCVSLHDVSTVIKHMHASYDDVSPWASIDIIADQHHADQPGSERDSSDSTEEDPGPSFIIIRSIAM